MSTPDYLTQRARELADSLNALRLSDGRRRSPKTTDAGEVERGLLKKNDDFGNGLMMLYHKNPPCAAPMTEREERDAVRPAALRDAGIARVEDPRVASAAILSQMIFDEENRTRDEDGMLTDYGGGDEPFYLDR